MSTSTTTEPRPPDDEPAPAPFEPRVRGESVYDKVTSALMSVFVGALLIFGWLSLIYLTTQAYASRVTAPIEIVEVYGGGGGSPEGTPGSTEQIDVAGAPPDKYASNNENEATDFEDPAVQATPAVALDAVTEAGTELAQVDLGAAMPTGGPVASGRRASKIGTGGPGFGFGPGDGGVSREQRWSIIYPPGQTIDEYARQLDSLGVELAAISNGSMQYASHFGGGSPSRRGGSGAGDNRLYFLWQGQGRKTSDVELLRRAGINVGEGAIFQFYPKEVEDTLAQLEVRYRRRQPAEIRMTRFQVVPADNGRYGFKVIAQEPLR